jgi:hypothetical protein
LVGDSSSFAQPRLPRGLGAVDAGALGIGPQRHVLERARLQFAPHLDRAAIARADRLEHPLGVGGELVVDRDDLDAIVAAAVGLMAGTLACENALADYFAALLRAHHGDASAIWSIDGVHAEYLGRG